MASAKAAGAKAKWQSLVGGNGYMGISLHSRNHEGEGLAAMVEWMNMRGQFEHVRVGLSDTLNRFNYAHSHRVSLTEAYKAVAQSGDAWLAENSKILDGLAMPHDLRRWSHWLENYRQEIEQNKTLFEHAYDEDAGLRSSIDADISAFLTRTHKLHDIEQLEASRRYLIEELAVYSAILRVNPATTVYPGKQLNCFAYMRDHKPAHLPSAIGGTGFIRLGIHGMDPAVPSPQPQVQTETTRATMIPASL